MMIEIEPIANISLAGLIARRKEIRARLMPEPPPRFLLARRPQQHLAVLATSAQAEARHPHRTLLLAAAPAQNNVSGPPQSPKPVTIQRIVVAVANFYKFSPADLLAPNRKREIVRIRQIAIYLAKTITNRSLPDIGRRIGGKDHTTVLHAIRKIEALLAREPWLAAEIDEIRRLLTSGATSAVIVDRPRLDTASGREDREERKMKLAA